MAAAAAERSCSELGAEDAELRAMFDELDTDGSGELERDEVAVMATRLGLDISDEALDAAIAEMDGDGNGAVDFEEFARWFRHQAARESSVTQDLQRRLNTHLSSLRGDRPALQGAVVYAFNLIDADGSGRLDEEEVLLAAEKLGVDVPNHAALFEQMERGPTGEVGFFAFRRWYLGAVDAGTISPPALDRDQSQSADEAIAVTERKLRSLVGHHSSVAERNEYESRQQMRRGAIEVPDVRHEFATRVGKSWAATAWHERLPYHAPRDNHHSARRHQALVEASRSGSRHAKLGEGGGSAPAPQLGQRYLQMIGGSPPQQNVHGPAQPRAAAAWPQSASQGKVHEQQPNLQPHPDPQSLASAAPGPPTLGTPDYDHCHSARSSLTPRTPKRQLVPQKPQRQFARRLIRQIPLSSDGRTAVAPCPSGKPHGRWGSARAGAVFSARSRPLAFSRAAAAAAAAGTEAVIVAGGALSLKPPMAKGGGAGGICTPNLHGGQGSRCGHASAAASATLRALRSRIGPEIRDRPADGWAAATCSSNIDGNGKCRVRGPPRCAPPSPGGTGAALVSVARSERIFAAVQSTLGEARMDKTMLKMQMGTMIGGGGGTSTTNRVLDFSLPAEALAPTTATSPGRQAKSVSPYS